MLQLDSLLYYNLAMAYVSGDFLFNINNLKLHINKIKALKHILI